MRRSFRFASSAPTVLVSPEAALGKVQIRQWIFRLLELPIPLDSSFFSCLRWCADGLKDLIPMLQKQMSAYPGRSRNNARLRQAVGELQKTSDKRLDDALEEFAEDHAWFQPQLRQCVQSFVSSRQADDDSIKSCVRSLQKIQKFFGARKKPLIHSETSGLIYGVFS